MHTSDLERIVLRQGAEIFALKHLVTTLAAHMTLANSLDKWKTETWSARSEEALAAFGVLKELCAEYMK